MRIALIITLILACLSPCLAQQPSPFASQPTVSKNVSDLLERAAKLSQAGRGSLAITLIQEAVRISPDSPQPHLALGTEYAKANRFDEAIAEFESARQINPRDDQVYLSVGLVMLQEKRYDDALSLFADASLLNPKEPLHHLMRGVALVREAAEKEFSGISNKAGRDHLLSQAEEALGKAFDLSGGQLVDVYLYRARVHELKGARMEAASELEKYLKASPDSAGANAVREAIRNLQTKAAPSQ
ncbi:MAG: protein O-mannosyl-transferase [Acidobacteriota bacterium]|jgi:tetratricopeptide (TPR) repeat protein|nr:protein O-mannosyl-transferase [Acidobacteriota bacterium]